MPLNPNDPITRVPFVDLQSGRLTRAGYWYLYNLTSVGLEADAEATLAAYGDTTTAVQSQAGEVSTLFPDSLPSKVMQDIQDLKVLIASVNEWSVPDHITKWLERLEALINSLEDNTLVLLAMEREPYNDPRIDALEVTAAY